MNLKPASVIPAGPATSRYCGVCLVEVERALPVRVGERRDRAADRLPFGDRQAAFGQPGDAADDDHRENERGDEQQQVRKREGPRAAGAPAAGETAAVLMRRAPMPVRRARAARARRRTDVILYLFPARPICASSMASADRSPRAGSTGSRWAFRACAWCIASPPRCLLGAAGVGRRDAGQADHP